jgi:hypothetical protein
MIDFLVFHMFLAKSNYYTPLFEAPETSRTLICQPLYRDHPYGCWPSRSKGGWTVEKGQFCLCCSWENDGQSMSILYFYDGKRWQIHANPYFNGKMMEHPQT